MSFDKTVAILGGDGRLVALAEYFFALGARVNVFGLPCGTEGGISSFADWKKALQGADVVILPLPAFPDGKHLSLPLCKGEDRLSADELACEIPKRALVAGGKLGSRFFELAQAHGFAVLDYFASEEFQLRNALPTAEGAIEILMRELPRVIYGLPVAVVGFGRVSRALCRLLFAMGARVTVAARNPIDLTTAELLGYGTLHLTGEESLLALTQGQAVICNTVPVRIFGKDFFKAVEKSTLLVELASSPGGFDADEAQKYGKEVVFALSLPGKCSPVTAGEIIADTVLSYLKREGLL